MKILGKDYLLVTLDFETFYATGYSLSALNTFAYVADDQFSIHGVGLKIEDEPTRWFNDTTAALAHIDECNTSSLPIALLCQNTYFDGWILHHHYDWHPDLYLDTMCMSRGLFPTSSASLEKLCERLWPNDPKMRKGKELVQFKGTTTEQLYANQAALKTMVGYCIQDVELTYAAFIRMEPYYPDSELRLIDLTLRMMCEPLLRIDVPRVEDCLANAIAHRTKQIENSGYAESTLSSNAKFEALIRKLGLPVPLKDSPTVKEPDGVTPKKIAALGKADLGFQELRRDHPQFEHIWQGRIAAKSVGEITRAERFLDTARQCDGYMPVPLVYYSAHCVPGDTEVLTPGGWVALQEWGGGLIAQVDSDQNIQFLQGERFVGPEVSKWLVSEARYMPCAFTEGHTVPYLTHGSMQWGTLPAADAAARSSIYVPIAGQLQTRGAITPEQMRVLVMIQADGSFCEDTSQGRQLTIFVKRPHKIQRARELLQAAGVTYRELTFDSHPGYVRFTVAHRDYPDWLRPDRKVFGAWLLDSTPDAREAFTQELRHWDECLNGRVQWSYSTSVRQNADWAVTLCHLTGRGASITTTAADNRGGYNRGENYTVNIRQRNYAQVKRTQWHLDHTPRATYCAKTITGYWLARANGQIFVTGNTGRYGGGEKLNLQNLGRTSELRRALCAQPGQMVYVADSSNIEARMLAWEAGQEDLLEIFRTGGDVYAYTAQDIYSRPIDKKKDPHERFVGKVTALGLGYGMGWRKFKDTLAAGALGGPPVFMAEHEVQHIVNTFRTKRWAIKNYWQQADQAIVDMYMGNTRQWGPLTIHRNCIVMPNGMALQYPGLRPAEDDEFGGWEYHNGQFFTKIYSGKLAENITQALARIVLFDQMLAINELFAPYGGRVVMNVHDEIIAVGPDLRVPEDQNELFQQMLGIMRTPPKWCPDLPLDGEGGVAAEYSK